jgi:hypothetical protein
VVTKGSVYVTGARSGSVEATDDGIDSVVPVPVTPSGAKAGTRAGCSADTSDTKVSVVEYVGVGCPVI